MIPCRFVVFNAEQTEGLNLPKWKAPEVTWDPNERAEKILKTSNAVIHHKLGNAAFYSPSADSITLPERGQFAKASDYYDTVLHELGHWTGHESRLNRDLSGRFGTPDYAKEELRAEIASMMLASEIGLPHNAQQHVAYVSSWIKVLKEDPVEIIRASADAQKITDFVKNLEQERYYVVDFKTRMVHRWSHEQVMRQGLHIIRDNARDAAIRHFKPVPYFIINACLGGDKPFTAVWEPGESQAGIDEQKRLIDRSIAAALQQRLKAVGQATVVSCSRTPKKIAQPKAFSLADIQLAASNQFGFSAEKTLNLCQSLYETHKATSYPRTDCSFLPESQHADAKNVLTAIAKTMPSLAGLVAKCDCSITSPTWNDKKITAHHGIIPTQQAADGSKFSDEERKIYRLIAERYLANFLPAHEYLACSIELRIATERFSAKGRLVTKPGWKIVTGAVDEDKADDEGQALPELQPGLQLPVFGIDCKEERMNPPAAFTEGTLIRAMENIHQAVDDPQSKKFLKEGDGIGTPATRAAIIAELKRKKYLEAKGKKIVATELGVHLLQVVPNVMKDPVLTALFERILREVEAGNVPLDLFIEKQKQLVINELKRLRK